jgi:hypothetical protein
MGRGYSAGGSQIFDHPPDVRGVEKRKKPTGNELAIIVQPVCSVLIT